MFGITTPLQQSRLSSTVFTMKRLAVIICLIVVIKCELPTERLKELPVSPPHQFGQFGEAEASTPSGLYGRGSNKFSAQPARSKSFPPNHNAAPSYFVSENNVEETPVSEVEEIKIQQPANYQFNYDVEEQEFGIRFSHHESRQGDGTSGSYDVLLPDGRVQHVEYQADEKGYRPKISYKDGAGVHFPQSQANKGQTHGVVAVSEIPIDVKAVAPSVYQRK